MEADVIIGKPVTEIIVEPLEEPVPRELPVEQPQPHIEEAPA
jgi:hypothetical protein